MGWEWHDRPHDDEGRWIKKHERDNVDVHIRLERALADRLRREAGMEHQEISAYVARVLQVHWRAVADADDFTGEKRRAMKREKQASKGKAHVVSSFQRRENRLNST